jgi:hypothetical protein
VLILLLRAGGADFPPLTSRRPKAKMHARGDRHMTLHRSRVIAVLLVSLLVANPALATTYISAEPIPTADVIGAANLARIETIGFTNQEQWSNRLLDECLIVDRTIDALTTYGAISTLNVGNTDFVVGAGGFEGVTHPSFVFTMKDAGAGAASAADMNVLGNALGYVLSQGSTALFTPDNPKANQFPLDYAVVTLAAPLSGERAKEFFEFVGTIDSALFSGLFAGFTQIDFAGSTTNNSMLFLRPAVTKQQFITGLSTAASRDPEATYVTLNNNGQPTTAKAGAAFPENDWVEFPNGDQYLSQVGNLSPALMSALSMLRQQHLANVADLIRAIERDNVDVYLDHQFRCS